MTTQAQVLKEKWRALQGAGARDIKFCFGPLAEETEESVCASINEALDAIERGEYSDLPPLGDSRRNGALPKNPILPQKSEGCPKRCGHE